MFQSSSFIIFSCFIIFWMSILKSDITRSSDFISTSWVASLVLQTQHLEFLVFHPTAVCDTPTWQQWQRSLLHVCKKGLSLWFLVVWTVKTLEEKLMWMYSGSQRKSNRFKSRSAQAAAMLVSLGGTSTWCFHTELYKFQSNVSANNSAKEYRTDRRLGGVVSLLMLYKVSNYSRTSIIRTSIIRTFRLSGLFLWSRFFSWILMTLDVKNFRR